MAYEVWEDTVTHVYCGTCSETYEVPRESAHAQRWTYCPACGNAVHSAHVNDTDRAAWWWWSCLPGCLPDSEAMGPFDSETEARADAVGG